MPEARLPKKIVYGELKWANAPLVVRRSDTKTPLKPPWRISTYQQSRGNKLQSAEQSGEASSEEVLLNMRQKESAKPSRNVHSAKPELRYHQQSCLALTSVVPSATDSLELELVSSAILKHTNSSISRMWLRLVIVSIKWQTNYYLFIKMHLMNVFEISKGIWFLKIIIIVKNKNKKYNNNHYENMPIQIYWIFLPPKKNENFQIKNSDIFSRFCSKHRLWVLVRTASPRRF